MGVTGDTLYETDEDFRLVFSNPTHARLDETAAQVVIGNDDKPPAVIDLGKNYGKLIQPVQVDGDHYFYFWDVSGDGVATGTDRDGTPGGWRVIYWSATPSASGHAGISLNDGYVDVSVNDGNYHYVAVEVW